VRVVAVLLFGTALLVATGCGNEDIGQTDARHAVEAKVETLLGYTGQVRCTHNPRPWFIEKEATVFYCAARRTTGSCDLFRATLGNAGWGVVLDRKGADCILPQ
jgi:hypothetical protein